MALLSWLHDQVVLGGVLLQMNNAAELQRYYKISKARRKKVVEVLRQRRSGSKRVVEPCKTDENKTLILFIVYRHLA